MYSLGTMQWSFLRASDSAFVVKANHPLFKRQAAENFFIWEKNLGWLLLLPFEFSQSVFPMYLTSVPLTDSKQEEIDIYCLL